MMLLKCCTQYVSKFGKLVSGDSFYSNPKEGQCQRMFKLPHNCIYFIYQQGHAQNPPSDALTLCELRTSRCSIWIQKRQRNQRSNCQHQLDHRKSKRIPSTSASLTTLKPLIVCITQTGKLFERQEYQTTLPASLETCMQVKKVIIRTRNRTTDWFKIGNGVQEGCILSLCLFNLQTEYIMRNAELDEAQAEIKIAGRNINNLR